MPNDERLISEENATPEQKVHTCAPEEREHRPTTDAEEALLDGASHSALRAVIAKVRS